MSCQAQSAAPVNHSSIQSSGKEYMTLVKNTRYYEFSTPSARMQDSSNSYVGTGSLSLSLKRNCSADDKFFQDVEAVSYIKMPRLSPRFAILNTIVYMMPELMTLQAIMFV
jgi:hypothetical protein